MKETLTNLLKEAASNPIYKPLLPFIKLARDCYSINPIISYWTLCYVVETGLKQKAKLTDDYRKFLFGIMDCLEKEKKARSGESLFANEKEAQKFIEDYGLKLIEKAEENDELMDKPAVAYMLYLSASNLFQMYTIFVREDEENAKRVKFCKFKAVECFKKKKEQEANPPKPEPPADDGNGQEEKPEPSSAGPSEPGNGGGACPYPTGPSGICPYPSSNTPGSFPSIGDDLTPKPLEPTEPPFTKDSSNNIVPPTPPAPAPAPASVPAPEKPKETRTLDDVSKDLSSLSLSESDSKRAELLCESALYAIKANDLLTAVDSLKQTLELLYKRARK